MGYIQLVSFALYYYSFYRFLGSFYREKFMLTYVNKARLSFVTGFYSNIRKLNN